MNGRRRGNVTAISMDTGGAAVSPASSSSERSWVSPIAKRPALFAAICFVVGIALHSAVPVRPILLLTISATFTAIGIAWHDRAIIGSLCIVAALVVSGTVIAQLEAFHWPSDHISQFATDAQRLAQLELSIDHEPRTLSDPYSPRPMPPKQVVIARVSGVNTWTGWQRASGEILVQISQPHPRLAIGQHVRILGMLERPAPASNPGQFDWAAYYRSQRILNSVHINEASNIHILSQNALTIPQRIQQTARRWLAAGFPASRSLDHALLRALLLGDTDPELRDVQDQFRKTGTSHHLSISGMHVAVLGGLVFLLCRIARMRPRLATIIMLAFVLIYGIAALPSPPVVRSILLAFFFGFGLLGRRAVDPLHLLAVSVWAMLVFSPMDFYNAGFQLSFGTVMGLMLFTPKFSEWFARLRQDEFALAASRATSMRGHDLSFARRATMWAEGSLNTAFAAGIVAWLVSMPLIAYHFGQINPWAIVASIILAPFVLIALIGGLAKVVLTALLPSSSGAWALAAAAPMSWMRHVLDWLARLPGSDYPLPGLPIWGLAILYAIFFLFLVPCPIPKLRICLRLAPFAAIAAAIVLPLRSIERAVVAPTELKFTLISLGAGQAGVLESPAGKTMMIDAGSSSVSDALRSCVAPYLRARGCTQIDSILLTHSDYDHISAAGAIASIYETHEVLIGPEFKTHITQNGPAEQLLKTLEQIDVPTRTLARGDTFPISRGVEVNILWPPRDPDPALGELTTNDSALVARLTYAGRSILITGDIEAIAERELMKHPDELKSDVLIAPHHGSSEETTAAFVKCVDPQFIISSNDRSLSGKQKRFDRICAEDHRTLYRTNDCGALTVHISEAGTVDVEPFIKH